MRMARKALRALRRNVPSPFGFHDATAIRPRIVHCCHHKVGTVGFENVLSAIADEFGLRFFSGEQSLLDRRTDIFLQDHSRIDRTRLGPFRGSHMIRDPRDVVISCYFHHRRTSEAWVLQPRSEYAGRSYQEHLAGLDREAGILAEIERSAPTVLRDMTTWDYGASTFHEIRYEELLRDEEFGFRRLFSHYGFSPRSVDRCVELACGLSLDKVRAHSKHIRSGQPGDWRAYFNEEHKAAFKRLTADAAVVLGYEADSDW